MMTFDYGKVKDPRFFKEGRLEAHSDHRFYRNVDEMEIGESGFKVSLNGLWKFHYAKNYKQTVADFMEEAYDCRGWTMTAVPGLRFPCPPIFRWKAMMHHSMRISSIRGKVMRKFYRERFRRDLIQLQAM